MALSKLQLADEQARVLLDLAMIGYGMSHALETVRAIIVQAKEEELVELFDVLIDIRNRADPEVADQVIEAAFMAARPSITLAEVREIINGLKGKE